MNYTALTATQHDDIRKQKLLEVEAEHARLALDLQLADGVGLQSEQVVMGRANLALLERQHAALVDMLAPPSPNGQGDAATVPPPDQATSDALSRGLV